MKNFIKFTFVIIITAFTSISSFAQDNSITIEYSSPYVNINITDGEVLIAEVSEDENYNVDYGHIETKSGSIKNIDLIDIVNAIEENGFMELDENYGAPIAVDHNTFRITIIKGGVKKQVIYRNNLAFSYGPDEFDNTEALLQDFVAGIDSWNN